MAFGARRIWAPTRTVAATPVKWRVSWTSFPGRSSSMAFGVADRIVRPKTFLTLIA